MVLEPAGYREEPAIKGKAELEQYREASCGHSQEQCESVSRWKQKCEWEERPGWPRPSEQVRRRLVYSVSEKWWECSRAVGYISLHCVPKHSKSMGAHQVSLFRKDYS